MTSSTHPTPPPTYTVGVISDTHGLLRPEAVDALTGVYRIIHAGDVGSPDILSALEAIAPVTAVRGNMDGAAWADHLPQTNLLQLDDRMFYVLHDPYALDLDPSAANLQAVIFGHTHWPANETKDGILYFNPGSAGPVRTGKPVSLGLIHAGSNGLKAEHIYM